MELVFSFSVFFVWMQGDEFHWENEVIVWSMLTVLCIGPALVNIMHTQIRFEDGRKLIAVMWRATDNGSRVLIYFQTESSK